MGLNASSENKNCVVIKGNSTCPIGQFGTPFLIFCVQTKDKACTKLHNCSYFIYLIQHTKAICKHSTYNYHPNHTRSPQPYMLY